MSTILIITERFWPEDFVINDLAKYLIRCGNLVTVLTQQPSYPHGRMPRGRGNSFISREKWHDIDIVRFKTVLGYRDSIILKIFNYINFFILGTINVLFRAGRFDKVFIYQTGPLTLAIPGIVAAKLKGKESTIWTQDVWPDSVFAYGFKKTPLLEACLNYFVKWVYKSVDNIAISCKGFAKIIGKYTDKAMVYAPNWALYPYSEPANSIKKSENKKIFIFAGNVGKVQNLENVIKGYAIANRKSADVGNLRIVGDGSALDELKNLANEEGVAVQFPGRIAPSDMNNEYYNADFLVLSLANKPVFQLTVPSKFQMYLSVGKPILCACAGEVMHAVDGGGFGVAADPDDPEKIAEGFINMSNASKEQIEIWQRNMKDALGDQFDRGKIQERLAELIIS